jgi:SAM-dependent methyltransferase
MSSGAQADRSWLQNLAGSLAESFLFGRGRKVWEENLKHWNHPLSKFDKLWCGSYLILKDYAAGIFPPVFEDRAKAFAGEIEYNRALPGVSYDEAKLAGATKPFWNAHLCRFYMGQFQGVYETLERYGVTPKQRILELGCGSGWMAEMLCLAGYSVVGTTIAPDDVEIARRKIASIQSKGLPADLVFAAGPMEFVHELPECAGGFDAVFIFEALHHAFDWRAAFASVTKVLKPGGWFLVANEPNLLHTFISYRAAKLSNTHEIGMSKRELAGELKKLGFTRVDVIAPRFENFKSHIWIMAQKG